MRGRLICNITQVTIWSWPGLRSVHFLYLTWHDPVILHSIHHDEKAPTIPKESSVKYLAENLQCPVERSWNLPWPLVASILTCYKIFLIIIFISSRFFKRRPYFYFSSARKWNPEEGGGKYALPPAGHVTQGTPAGRELKLPFKIRFEHDGHITSDLQTNALTTLPPGHVSWLRIDQFVERWDRLTLNRISLT